MMGSNEVWDSNHAVSSTYHSQIEATIKVICIGAGFSGLCLAYKMQKSLSSFHLTVYEKNPDIGGTWLENRYPGCACDIPAHIYTFSWWPKADWSHYYAGAEEIHQYCKDFYSHFQLQKYMQLSHRVTKAEWDDEKGQYEVEVEDLRTGKIKTDWCHVLINAAGFLNKWKWPNIPGLDSFQGQKVHSASWDKSVDCTGKRIGVIGNGSSAIQIVPQIQKQAGLMKVFMRSPTWISPHAGTTAISYIRGPSADSDSQKQFAFTKDQIKRFQDDPDFHLMVRRQMEADISIGADAFIVGSEMQVAAQKAMTAEMKRRIGVDHEELAAKLIPTWVPGCRRITPGDGYLEALTSKNAEPIFGEISEIRSNSLIMSDGKEHEIDILICATGFDVSFVPSFELRGDGLPIADLWKDEPESYLGLAAPNFPNYFTICGPGGPVGNGSVLPAVEVLCDHFIDVMKKMQAEKILSLQPKREVVQQLQEHMKQFHRHTVWTQPCRSWYKNGTIDAQPQLWCGSTASYIKTTRRPRYEDYKIKYKYGNEWVFLGNGKVLAHEPTKDGKPDINALAPYIRNADVEWEIN